MAGFDYAGMNHRDSYSSWYSESKLRLAFLSGVVHIEPSVNGPRSDAQRYKGTACPILLIFHRSPPSAESRSRSVSTMGISSRERKKQQSHRVPHPILNVSSLAQS